MRATIRIVDTVMYRIGSTSPKNLVVISGQDEEDLNIDYNKLAGFIQISEPWKFVK